ncbi:MAG: DUF3857 and transglutaminase domain-containing protein, partial [Candidatus Acidiferrales bacterium]
MPRQAIKYRCLGLGLLLGAFGIPLALPAHAGTAPDWVRAAMAEKLPTYPDDTIAVVLLEDEQITVKDNGEVEDHTRRVIKLLRPGAVKDYGAIGVSFDSQSKITYMKGWTFTPGGQEVDLTDKDAAELSTSSYEVFSDERVRIFAYPQAGAGSVVAFESIQKRRPDVFDDAWRFQKSIPVHRTRYSIQMPTGWEFTALWANYAEQKPQSFGSNGFAWEATDVPAIEDEPDMPPWPVVDGHMLVKFFPRDPAMRSKTTGSWQDIGMWYSGLLEGRRLASPEIKAKVAALTAGKATTLEKMEALAAYSQHQIRYAAIEVGIGGFQPHAAGDVLSHGYGDCKDKATLLNTMLGEIGVESYNVMIDTERGYVRPNFPAIHFDHSIVAIRLPDDVPESDMYAVVKDAKLGRLLFFDPTDEFVPLGYIPSIEQGSYALVVARGGGELVQLP